MDENNWKSGKWFKDILTWEKHDNQSKSSEGYQMNAFDLPILKI